ncbi:MAG: hypothetical protein RJA57_565 [Bacteroidota bacterium]
MSRSIPILSPEQALPKLRHYCAYQERCHQEVRDKLFELGVRVREHDTIIASLIEDNYLNEERFAVAFAGGKWRIKRWGRVRIRYELRQRQVSEYCIRKALKEIDEEEYREVLRKLVAEKCDSLRKESWPVRKKKVQAFAIGRGFEAAMVLEYLNDR